MTQTTTLIEKIILVLEDNDTGTDVFNKIVDKYPEVINHKIQQRGSEDKGISQLKAEILTRIATAEGKFFNIDRTENPHRYFHIIAPKIIDEDIDEINEDIDITKSEVELDIGYIYIIDSQQLDRNGNKIVKIGKTINIEKRIKQLNTEQTAVYPYIILHQFKVCRPYKIEHALHNILDMGRISPNKEFFNYDYVEARMELIKINIAEFEVN